MYVTGWEFVAKVIGAECGLSMLFEIVDEALLRTRRVCGRKDQRSGKQ